MNSRFPTLAVLGLTLALFCLDHSDSAHIQTEVAMKNVLARTQLIFTAKVDAFDKDKRTAIFVVDEHLKGKAPFKRLLMALPADKEGAREYNKPSYLAKRLAVTQSVVFFADAKEGAFAPIRRGNIVLFLYTNGTWIQLAATTTDGGQADLPIQFHHFEPYLQRTFKGPTADMRQVIIDGLSGKKEPPAHNPKEPGGLGPEVK